jgi:hypothetical protein
MISLPFFRRVIEISSKKVRNISIISGISWGSSRKPINPINQTDDLNVLSDPNDQNGINQTNPQN